MSRKSDEAEIFELVARTIREIVPGATNRQVELLIAMADKAYDIGKQVGRAEQHEHQDELARIGRDIAPLLKKGKLQ